MPNQAWCAILKIHVIRIIVPGKTETSRSALSGKLWVRFFLLSVVLRCSPLLSVALRCSPLLCIALHWSPLVSVVLRWSVALGRSKQPSAAEASCRWYLIQSLDADVVICSGQKVPQQMHHQDRTVLPGHKMVLQNLAKGAALPCCSCPPVSMFDIQFVMGTVQSCPGVFRMILHFGCQFLSGPACPQTWLP